MKFICQKESILKEISNANDFTAQRNILSVLANVCLILNGNSLVIKTTDQKMGYISEITVNGIEDGTTTVLCDKFLDVIKNLPDADITFEEKEEKMIIKPENQSMDFKLRTTDSSSFPVITLPEEDNFFSVPQKDLTDMINQVSFAVSDDESKFAMNGALLEKDGNGLIMVGTDGRRLSYINRKIDHTIPDFNSATIPSKFLGIIRKLSVNEGSFDICVSPLSIFIRFGSCTIFSNLIKNEFPSYRRVIPENQTKNCIVNIKKLEEALRRVSILAESKYKKIIIEFKADKMIISCEENDLGTGKVEIDCSYDAEELKCAMNYTYLLNPIKVMEGTDAKISFTENSRPFTVTAADGRDYIHVIMPMNLN